MGEERRLQSISGKRVAKDALIGSRRMQQPMICSKTDREEVPQLLAERALGMHGARLRTGHVYTQRDAVLQDMVGSVSGHLTY